MTIVKRRMTKPLGGVLLTLTIAWSARLEAQASPTLRVIGTNDFHGALEARRDPTGRLWGGGAALAGAIAHARAECVAPACYSILVDAGDEFQGQAASTLARGQPVSEIFNHIGYDAAALGNHDLDWGRGVLRARMAQEHYPVLSANIRTSDGKSIGWIAPDTIIRRGPFVVGVIGIMTLEAQTAIAESNLAGIEFIDPVPVVDSLSRQLRRRGANVVIVLAHAGADCTDAARTVCAGEILDDARRLHGSVDAIVAGHRHVLLNSRIDGTPVTSARMSGQAIDVIDLTPATHTARAQVRDVFVDSVHADPAVERLVASALRAAGPRLDQRIAMIAEDMPQDDYGELAVGNLLADGMRAAGHADFAAMNHGGVRASLRAGAATYASLFEIQPFGNRLVEIHASGASMRRYFERMVSARLPGAFVSGARAVVDTTRPPGSRIVSLTLDSGRPLDDRARYTIVINDFMATGGDDLAFTDSSAVTRDLGVIDLDATVTYLKKLPSPVHAPSADRWTFKP